MRRATTALSAATLAALCSTAAPANAQSPQPAAGWSPAQSPLFTPWAEDLDPAAPLPEYPRPQLKRDQWTNLNGLWDYAITPRDAGLPSEWNGEILVPFPIESALSGVKKFVQPDQALWYRTTFNAPTKTGDNGRLLLHFGACDWETTVSVNGTNVGTHRGGFDPFTLDITDALTDSGEQTLTVRVWDPTDSGLQPTGKQTLEPRGIWYTAVTGIWQTVWLEPVPAASIADARITTEIDPPAVTVTAETHSAKTHGDHTTGLQVKITDAATGRSATGPIGRPITLRLKPGAHELWTPDTPALHALTIELVRNGETVDTVESYFGLRTITMGEDADGDQRLLLNGEPLFHFGPLDQGWWPDGLYTAPTDEALAFDIEVTKAMGFNMARKHTKTEPDRWYYHADRLGLLVWQDMPTIGTHWSVSRVAPGAERDANLPPDARTNFRAELAAMLDALESHPSIVVWVPFNEGWGQHDTNATLEWVMGQDPTRLVDGPSGWQDMGGGHMKDMHSYPGPGMFPTMPDRASVLGEYGGLGLPLPGHTWLNEGNWGYRSYENADALEAAYTDQINRLEMLAGTGLAAAVYTQTTDVEREVNGLLTYDRKVQKIPTDRLFSMHQKLYHAADKFGEITTLLPTAETDAKTDASHWRYTTSTPAEGWHTPGFNDRSWKTGKAGFGTSMTPGAVVGTEWDGSDIWLRRTVEFDAPKGKRLALRIHHDEDTTVYLNGARIFEAQGWTTSYTTVILPPEAANAAKDGANTIAVHTHQEHGGQYIDLGLTAIEIREE